MAAVYIIANQDGECVKVGFSKSPEDRLEKLQESTPHRLVLVSTFTFETARVAYMVEQRAHRALSFWRLKGEWFSCCADTAEEAIRDVIRKAWCDLDRDGSQIELVSATPLDEVILC